MGNLYRSKDRRDRAYNPAGQILRSGPNTYRYDADGNLVERVIREDEVRPGDEGTWRYRWNGAGMLTEVLRPDRHAVSFTYDALGRRLSKAYRDKTTYWAWDGNVPLHEWTVTQPGAVWDGVSEGTRLIRAGVPLRASPANARAVAVKSAAKLGKTEVAGRTNPDELTDPSELDESTNPDNELDRTINELVKQVNVELNTYLFEPGTFTPLAKFTPTRQLSVVSDHLGTPAALYDGAGELVWQNRMDIYGRPLWTDGLAADMWFRYPGQYEDNETGLSYNRFRYYDAGVGCYISRDPIGLAGGNPTLYGYVGDVNGEVDVFGLSCLKVSDARRKHILDGIPTGTAHGPNRGLTRGAFPDTWTDDQAIAAIERVANSSKSTWKQSAGPGFMNSSISRGGPSPDAPLVNRSGNSVRHTVRGNDHGLEIEVIVDPANSEIITGYVKRILP